MDKKLPARPNLEHLRRQAKTLLAALASRDSAAAATVIEHLPAAQRMKVDEVFLAGFRLADAQSAIARQNGFAAWPHLARHVEQLRALEGAWSFARLEVDGVLVPPGALLASRILIDGDRFRTESPEATYEGVFNIDVESDPHGIDIEFVEGPEAGNWNYGIFRLNGDQLEICLDMNGRPRPEQFATSAGSGRACEILKRVSSARPDNVTGGVAAPLSMSAMPSVDLAQFKFVPSATLTKLQGDWTAVKIISDGQALPGMMLKTGHRRAVKNELTISFAGRTMIHALVRLDESATPIQIDYCNLDGPMKGTVQHGIFKWDGNEACSCMGGVGQPRPTDFTSSPGSGRTFSQWRPKR
jgi:uncharacterized protein (TIGR03067 family)